MKKLLIALLILFTLVGCNNLDEDDNTEKVSLFNDEIILRENEGTSLPIILNGIEEERIKVSITNPNVIDYYEDDLSIKAKKIGYTKIIVDVEEINFHEKIDVYVQKEIVKAPELKLQYSTIAKNIPAKIFFDETKVGATIESFNFSVSDDAGYIDDNYIFHPDRSGEITITATLKNNPQIVSSIKITVLDSFPTDKLFLSTKDSVFTLKPGEYLDLFVNGEHTGIANEYDYKTYTSSIATITDDGRIVGIKEGYANIGVVTKGTNRISGSIWVKVEGNNQIDYAKRLIEVALSEEGYREGYNKDTRYGEWYGWNNLDWCAMFVS